MVTKNVTTITLSGETAVQFNQTYNYFWITNLGDDDVFASMDSGITEGADGVIIIPSGSSASTMHGYNSDTVYLNGNGKVQVMGTFSAFNPFKVAKKGGEFKTASGDDNYTIKTAEFPLINLDVYGRSWQSSIPSTDTPVAIESIGDSGSLLVTTKGKNLLDPSWFKTYSVTGVDYKNNGDGTFTVSGTATAWAGNVSKDFILLPGTYTISRTAYDSNLNVYIEYKGVKHQGTFTVTEPTVVHMTMQVISGRTVDITFSVQLERSETATSYEPYKSTAAGIITSLPLRGIPVSTGGNYIDSKNQEWICDTIEHVYGENAQAVKRITEAVVASAIDMHGGSALLYEYSSPGDEFPRTEWYFESGQITDSGKLIGTTYLWRKYYDKYGDLITDQAEGPGGSLSTSYDPNKYKLIGDWKADDGSVSVLAEPLPYVIDNGEPIPDDYICTTGVLTERATIIYPLENPVATALSAEEIQALNNLQTFSKITNIYNTENADVSVKYCASQTISDTILPIINCLKGDT